MKRKLADRSHWGRVLEKRFSVTHIDTEEYEGYVTLLELDRVVCWVCLGLVGTHVCIVDTGFAWLQQFPKGAQHAITTTFNEHGKIVQWYIDIIKQHSVNEEGIPWYDDLYLDIAHLPTGEVMIMDADELDEALEQGIISQSDHDLAWQETRRLMRQIEDGTLSLLRLCEAHRDRLQRLMSAVPVFDNVGRMR